ncbi:hypothetical protein D046_7252C, partial [Vibrio parahaemolyticus V-223/04]
LRKFFRLARNHFRLLA